MTIDYDKERQALLDIHTRLKQSHLEGDADQLISFFGDPVLRVRDGVITKRTRQAMHETYLDVFKNTDYHIMEDLDPPIIRISQDATMAWMINRYRVQLTLKNAEGGEQDIDFIYAGIVTFEKLDDSWVRTANVFTAAE